MSYGYAYAYRYGTRAAGPQGPTIALSASSVLENALTGSTVGVLSVVNGEGTWTFTEVADPDNKFVLAGTGGSNLNTSATLSFATAPSHSVTISATNGTLTIQRTFTIIVRAVGVATLTDPIDQYIGTSAASLTISTNRNNGTLYWYLSRSESGIGNLTATNIKTGATVGSISPVAFGSQPVTSTGRQTVPVSGLDPATGYYTYWVHENSGLDSNIVRAHGFATDGVAGHPRIVAEGDSITFWNLSYAFRWRNANPTVPFANQARTSAVIGLAVDAPGANSLWGRAQQTIANNPRILTLLIGANDLGAINDSAAWLTRLYNYLDYIWANCPNLEHVLVAGILPQKILADATKNNTQRAIVNPILRSGGGTRPGGGPRITGYIPFGDAVPDDYAGVDIISADGVHPEIEGRKLMARIYAAVMDPIIAGATGSNPAAFTLLDQNNVALGGTATAETLVTGMGIGATATASQTGGRIARGPAAIAGGTVPFGTSPVTVCNGDIVRVEATGAATNDTDTNVALTIGTRADTFTARTRPATVVEFEHSTDGRTNHNSFSGGQSIFTNVTFPAGRPVVMVTEDGRNETAVTINGISATRVGAPETTTHHSLWIGPPSQNLTAGNYEVRVSSPNTNAWCAIAPGAIRNCTQEVSDMTVRKLPFTTFTERHIRTEPTTIISNGGLALYAYRGLPASFTDFLEGENVHVYDPIPSASNLALRWGRGTRSGDLGIGINASTGGHGLVLVALSAGLDETPDAFTFTDQTGVALSTVIESNTITVSGIAVAVAISISGGEYQVNGGAWTSSPGTVSNGDAVKVRHTSSAANSTATNTTLTIGGVSDTFTSTTEALPGAWILSAGTWNDAGEWDDADTWKDN